MSYKPLNVDAYISAISKRRLPSPIRSLMPLTQLPGMISLGGGLPNPQLFPFKGVSFTLMDGTQLDLTDKEVSESLQYAPTPGVPQFLDILRHMQKKEHNPQIPDDEWAITVTTGSADALWKAFETFIDEGDNVLLDESIYSGSLAYLKPLNCNLVGIPVDGLGLIPEKMEEIIIQLQKDGKKRPRVLYTIPTGQNPLGTTADEARRIKIYELACKYDLIILEDDPYYYLYYGSQPAPTTPEQEANYQRPKLRSIWSYDKEGRVIRFDSFSKILSSGVRLGFATGPKGFIEKINLVSQATALHTSSLSQMMIYRYLKQVGDEGWDKHCNNVSLFYQKRRDTFIRLCEKHLTGLAEWTAPTAGMFVWFKLHGFTDTKALIETKARDAKVLLVPGEAFSVDNSKSCYVRAAFSTATEEQMDLALQRLAGLLKK